VSGSLGGLSILVTGGGSGIGRAVTRAYLAAGAHVTVLERDPAAADELVRAGPDTVYVVVGDATDPAAVDRAVAVAGADGRGLDQLTCCVGVFDYYASVRDLDPERLAAAAAEIWQVNVLSALLAVNRAYPRLRAARGSVTLTLSESAFGGHGGGVLYGSSKWALRGVVAHLSADLAPEVRVNGVAPGGTSGTRLGGLGALGQDQTADAVPGRSERIKASTLLQVLPEPGDHAGAYVFLADRVASRVCTGVVINTDGGRP
jgi:NAD(P)-dependent dehydrogenase (short-subunit alcohol dehydrogenase family)